ncbi:MAG: prolipoprotein diacylglyceryl transferase [bacterium]
MLRTLLGPKSFEANPLYIALVVLGLIFFSMALSFAQAQKRPAGQAIGLGVIFAIIGDGIVYALWGAMGWPQNYQFNNVAIYSYGFMLMVAFIMATLFLVKRGAKPEWGLSQDTVLDLMTFIIIGSILGARILYVALEWNTQYGPLASGVEYANNGEAWKAALMNVAKINEGGLSFHGGILGALVLCFFYIIARGLPYWRMADFVAPAVALGGIFGRIGCFLNGCCIGVATHDVPGVVFPVLNDGIARHPVQLYESFGHLLLFMYLVNSEKSAKFPGHTFIRFIVGYSWVRLVTEWFRFGESGEKLAKLPVLETITKAQGASLLVIIAGSILIFVLKRMYATPEDGDGGGPEPIPAPPGGKLVSNL